MRKLGKTLKSLIVIVTVSSMFLTGCNKEKNITLNNDVKNEDSNSTRTLQRVKKLNIDEKQYYFPIYWKNDDNNIIAIGKSNYSKLGIYNINLESSEINKINEIEANYLPGRNSKSNNLIFRKSKDICIYDVEKNEIKEIYNLNKVIEKIKIENKTQNDEEILNNTYVDFVKGNDKYAYIISQVKVNNDTKSYITLLDIQANSIFELVTKVDFVIESISYSKLNNKFYVSSDGKLYNFTLENSQDFKELIKIPHLVFSTWQIDNNGEFAYYSIGTDRSQFMKYDIKDNTVSEVKGINFSNDSELKESAFDLSINKDIASFSIISYNPDGEKILSKVNTYVGKLNGNSINTFGKVELKITDKNNSIISIINDKGDKMFNAITYYNSNGDTEENFEYTVEKIK